MAKIAGTSGDDTLVGTSGADVIFAGKGDDRVFGGKGDDLLNGEAGDDYLEGGEGNDQLWGGAGRDDLFGGAGDDDLYGGEGFDFMSGGSGADDFIIKASDLGTEVLDNAYPDEPITHWQRIADLNFAEGDRVLLTGFNNLAAAVGYGQAIDSAAELKALAAYVAAQDSDDVIVRGGGQDSISLVLHDDNGNAHLVEFYGYADLLV